MTWRQTWLPSYAPTKPLAVGAVFRTGQTTRNHPRIHAVDWLLQYTILADYCEQDNLTSGHWISAVWARPRQTTQPGSHPVDWFCTAGKSHRKQQGWRGLPHDVQYPRLDSGHASVSPDSITTPCQDPSGIWNFCIVRKLTRDTLSM